MKFDLNLQIMDVIHNSTKSVMNSKIIQLKIVS